jgi:hypothetical protein
VKITCPSVISCSAYYYYYTTAATTNTNTTYNTAAPPSLPAAHILLGNMKRADSNHPN